MAAVRVNASWQSVYQYIRSFLVALPRLRVLVADLHLSERMIFDPRRDLDARHGQIRSQLFAASITFVQFMTSIRTMRRVMEHHCNTYSIALDSCPTAMLASEIEKQSRPSAYKRVLEAAVDNYPGDYRPAYARALLLEDEGKQADAALAYSAIAAKPSPGPYALMRAAELSEVGSEIEQSYRKAVELYPNFSRAQRGLGKAMKARSPLDAAAYYANALSHGPRLEYDEQSWAIARRGWVEVDVYEGFRIFFSPEEARNVAIPRFLGMPTDGVTARSVGFRRRFLGLALMRFHKDRIWRREMPTASSGAGVVAAHPGVEKQEKTVLPSAMVSLWWILTPLRRWVIGHYGYFQFVLVGKDVGDIKRQIDRINVSWMRDGIIG